VRFHTPEISQLLQEREQHKETLQVEADKAYKTFLQEITQHYFSFRDIINKLATADCLMSLATFSLHGEVCKPTFVNDPSLSIVDGRHPIIEQVRSEPYVPNSISLGGSAPRHLVVSGPNVSVCVSPPRLT
jgi:DNA mismatch repair protein MSH3